MQFEWNCIVTMFNFCHADYSDPSFIFKLSGNGKIKQKQQKKKMNEILASDTP